MISARIRTALLGGALGIAALTGCGGAADSLVDEIRTDANVESAESSSAQESDTSSTANGPSLMQTVVPIPDEQTFYEVTAPPPHWPAFIGVPEALDVSQGFFLDQPTQNGRSLSATFIHDDGESFGIQALDQIIAMGFETILDNEGNGRFVILRRGDQEVQITIGPESTKISITE